MLGIRAGPVGHQKALDALIGEVDEMESRLRGMKREIRDADHVALPDPVSHPRDLRPRDVEQAGIAPGGGVDLGKDPCGKCGCGADGKTALQKIATVHEKCVYHLIDRGAINDGLAAMERGIVATIAIA